MTCQAYPGSGIIYLAKGWVIPLKVSLFYLLPCRLPPVGDFFIIIFLLEKKFIYRDKKGKLMPYAEKNNGLFEVKECFNEKTQWSGTQTMITPKGRETFRLLYIK